MSEKSYEDSELLRLVIEEVDDARDILALAHQLRSHLPIRSFDDLLEKAGKAPLKFRHAEFDVGSLRAHLPSMAFPVDTLAGLVERIGYIVRVAPPALGIEPHSEDGERRRMRLSGQFTRGMGMLSSGGLTAITYDPRAKLDTVPTRSDTAA